MQSMLEGFGDGLFTGKKTVLTNSEEIQNTLNDEHKDCLWQPLNLVACSAIQNIRKRKQTSYTILFNKMDPHTTLSKSV